MTNILVTGGNGQLGNCLKDLSEELSSQYNFIFKSSEELDITDFSSLTSFFESKNLNYCINCAAYTNVDQAEDDKALATSVNVNGVENLSKCCAGNGTVLIHISTDFVFDGESSNPYLDKDETNPINHYGSSKLLGEDMVLSYCEKHFIFRTSWLYSEHNNNFMKTMLKLSKIKDSLNVVWDQIGTPTYAKDLSKLILKIIQNKMDNFGLYHFSNEGVASWYDFAYAIFVETESEIKLLPINTSEYPTRAVRPHFSVLDKSKVKQAFGVEIPHWRLSLKVALKTFQKLN